MEPKAPMTITEAELTAETLKLFALSEAEAEPYNRPWTAPEEAAVAKFYATYRAAGRVLELIAKWKEAFPPGRTYNSMVQKARTMGIARPKRRIGGE
ncbi:MAG: hypothetical protein GY851_35535 [bacterium]|nr:hypothetical protein [bacterium]